MFGKLARLYEIGHTNHKTLYAMEGLRGLAVFLVFLVHFIALSTPWVSELEGYAYYTSIVQALGNIGVDLFFVLSGYLIYGSLISRSHNFFKYLRRRIQRIYPTFIAVFAVYLVLSFVLPEKSKIPGDLWEAVGYVSANFFLLPGIVDIEPIITVAWSLSYEFFFYLSVPLVIFALNLRSWTPIGRVVLFLLLGAAILVAPSAFGGHVRFAMFVSGILVYEISKSSWLPKQMDLLGLSALVLALIITVLQQTIGFSGQWKFAVLAVSFFLLCLACFLDSGYSSKVFRWTPLRWLGNISYSYYLVHGLILNAFFLLLSKYFAPSGTQEGVFWFSLLLGFIFTFVGSTFLFMYVEKPFSLTNRRAPMNWPTYGRLKSLSMFKTRNGRPSAS